jgi:tetratricopeptide (TPR) repeat protein
VLDRASLESDERFVDVPLVEAAVRQMLGETYHGLGEDETAKRHLARAVEIRREQLGEKDPLTLESMHALGAVQSNEEMLTRTLALRRKLLGEEHIDTLRTMEALASLNISRLEELRQIHAIRGRTLGEDHPDTLRSAIILAAYIIPRPSYVKEAIEILRATVDRSQRTLGANHPLTLMAQSELGWAYMEINQFSESAGVLGPLLERQKQVLGGDHPDTMRTRWLLAACFTRSGQYDLGESLLTEALPIATRRFGMSSKVKDLMMDTLADADIGQGKYAQGEALYRQQLATRKERTGFDALLGGKLWTVGQLMRIALATGRETEAVEVIEANQPSHIPEAGWIMLASVHAYLRNQESHRAQSDKLRSAATSETFARELWPHTVMAILTMPVGISPDGSQWAIERARSELDHLPNRSDLLGMRLGMLARGLAELRDGRLDQAAEFLEQAAVSEFPSTRGAALAYRAIAEFRLGQFDNARSTLADAAELIDPMAQVTYQVNAIQWIDLLWAQSALAEARSLIEPATQSTETAEVLR